MSGSTLSHPPYGNCVMLSPAGEVMCRCDEKKVRWYLARGLAEVVSRDPLTIRLVFQPNGQGHAGDPFFLGERTNRCVVCGSHEQLTKHHIVPSCYRTRFPEALKSHCSYDVMPLCRECHRRYEAESLDRKKELAERYGAPLIPPPEPREAGLEAARKAAAALVRHRERIPPARAAELEATVTGHLGRPPGPDDLERLARIPARPAPPGWVDHGQRVVSQLEDLEAFVQEWRAHFLATLEPRFLPPYWDPERPLARAATPPAPRS